MCWREECCLEKSISPSVSENSLLSFIIIIIIITQTYFKYYNIICILCVCVDRCAQVGRETVRDKNGRAGQVFLVICIII